MKGYGEPWQYSVFFCKLKEVDRLRMENDLKDEMNQKEDRIIIIDLGPNEKAARQATSVLGQALPKEIGDTIII